MEYQGKLHLTNMCLVYNCKGEILVQNRIKNDWPGINLPGGHVEVGESLEESVIREMKEETGLDLIKVEKCGFYEWNIPQEQTRHLCVLFRCKDYKGNIKSSEEGEIFWIKLENLSKYQLSQDLEEVIKECLKGINI